jgi:4-hydroxy-2-oxoheptanedioate aldolase
MLRRKSNGSFLRRLREARVLGTFVKLPAVEVLEIAAWSGFDFVVVDLEHSQLSAAEAMELVRHAHALGFPALVRLPACDSGLVNRLLEGGAAGIQLSSVQSAEQVKDLVSATRYPPAGRRSVSLAHPVAGYGARPLKEVVAGEQTVLVGQIETAETHDPLDVILSAGLDVAFVGTTDLLVDLEFDRERLAARVEEIRKAAQVAGVVLGTFAGHREEIGREFGYVVASSDIAILQGGMKALAEEARLRLGGAGRE